jgi:copper chaperone CopZ
MTMTQTTTRTYTVGGMSCSHCANSVHDQVARVPGVDAVQVDLPTGRLTISGHDFSDAAIGQAVADAGYQLATND